jgi:hypothetical protein
MATLAGVPRHFSSLLHHSRECSGGANVVTFTVTALNTTAALPMVNPFRWGALPVAWDAVRRKAPQGIRAGSVACNDGISWIDDARVERVRRGGGGSTGGGTPTPTPHYYTLTVTATSGTLSQSTKLTLTVQ